MRFAVRAKDTTQASNGSKFAKLDTTFPFDTRLYVFVCCVPPILALNRSCRHNIPISWIHQPPLPKCGSRLNAPTKLCCNSSLFPSNRLLTLRLQLFRYTILLVSHCLGRTSPLRWAVRATRNADLQMASKSLRLKRLLPCLLSPSLCFLIHLQQSVWAGLDADLQVILTLLGINPILRRFGLSMLLRLRGEVGAGAGFGTSL